VSVSPPLGLPVFTAAAFAAATFFCSFGDVFSAAVLLAAALSSANQTIFTLKAVTINLLLDKNFSQLKTSFDNHQLLPLVAFWRNCYGFRLPIFVQVYTARLACQQWQVAQWLDK